MPTVNIYYKNKQNLNKLLGLSASLKVFLADLLTCNDIRLSPNEISLRFLKTEGNETIASVELEINAAAFKDRVLKQDKICKNVRKFIMDRLFVKDVRVWLILSELGHSW